MILRRSNRRREYPSLPRMRGDDPVTGKAAAFGSLFAPHARG